MSDTKHTPGPWRTDAEWAQRVCDEAARVQADHQAVINRLRAVNVDLLAALKTLTSAVLWVTDQTDQGRLNAIEQLHKHGDAIENARTAIAKAEGADNGR